MTTPASTPSTETWWTPKRIWTALIVIGMLLIGAFAPPAPSSDHCEQQWEDFQDTPYAAAQGHRLYVANCHDSDKALDELLNEVG